MIKRPVPLTLTARRTPSKLTYWRTLLAKTTCSSRLTFSHTNRTQCSVLLATLRAPADSVQLGDQSQSAMVNRTGISASDTPARAWDHWSSFFAESS
jgi:hypothetical protein